MYCAGVNSKQAAKQVPTSQTGLSLQKTPDDDRLQFMIQIVGVSCCDRTHRLTALLQQSCSQLCSQSVWDMQAGSLISAIRILKPSTNEGIELRSVVVVS